MVKEEHPGWVYKALKEEGVKVAIICKTRGGYIGRRYVPPRGAPSAKWEATKKMIQDLSKFLPTLYKKLEEAEEAKTIVKIYSYESFHHQFIGGNILAATAGWQIPRFLIEDDKDAIHNIFYTPEIIWADAVDDRVEGLIFVPPIPTNYKERALRLSLTLRYSDVPIADMICQVFQLPPPSTNLPPNALDYITRRFGKRGIPDGAYIIPFTIKEIQIYKWKCDIDAVKIREISRANLHLHCEQIAARNKDYCPIRSRKSQRVIVRIPERELGPTGQDLRRRLRALSKASRDIYFSDPINRKRTSKNMARWRKNNPEKYRKECDKKNERWRHRYKTDPEFHKKQLEKQRLYRQERREELNRQERERFRRRYQSDPEYRKKYSEKKNAYKRNRYRTDLKFREKCKENARQYERKKKKEKELSA